MLYLTFLRQKLGLSKAALARRACLDQGLISKIEAGRVRPYAIELQRIAHALDVHVDEAQTLLDQISQSDATPSRDDE